VQVESGSIHHERNGQQVLQSDRILPKHSFPCGWQLMGRISYHMLIQPLQCPLMRIPWNRMACMYQTSDL
jgi:hypothetical protein